MGSKKAYSSVIAFWKLNKLWILDYFRYSGTFSKLKRSGTVDVQVTTFDFCLSQIVLIASLEIEMVCLSRIIVLH